MSEVASAENAEPSNSFLLPHECKPERLIRLLGGDACCAQDDSTTFALRFYDSFDWRLHDAGLRLLRVEAAGGAQLRLKPASGGEVIDSVESDAEPAWPGDLPSGELRDRVSGCLDMRVLLPLATVRGEAIDFRYLNDERKMVVRLQMLRMQCEADGLDEPRNLWPRLRLLPVLGYDSEFAELARKLADELEWPNASDCLFDEVMTAVGREAGDYSSKMTVTLKPDQMAIKALRRILASLLDTLERNIPGARADLDSEFLHDLRVATRRTRSALSQVKKVLPQAVVDEYKQRFAWLGQITGPTRDLDVFLLELPKYRASLPTAMADDLDDLEAYLRNAHQTEQARLKRKLGSPEMRSLLSDWRTFLDKGHTPGEDQWFADLPIRQVASQRIWRMYKRVLKAGRAVHVDGPAEEMHALRKDCKKLRYLIEFFRSLYPARELKKIIKTLKELLDTLGEFQDLEVQADKLRTFADEIDHRDQHSARGVMAIGALVADLLRRQQAAHDRFAACFAGFDTRPNRDRYRQLFKAEDGTAT